jgi:hypothetical protein
MNEPHHSQHELGPEPAVPDAAAGHELSDVSIGGLITFLAGLVVSLAVVVMAVAGMFVLLMRQAEKADPPQPPLADLRAKDPPAPRLQEAPALDMRKSEAEQAAALRETRWIDKEAKVVQLPIERAMQLVVERGLPDWPSVESDGKQSKTDEAAGKEKKQADDIPGSGKNPDAKARESVPEQQPSDLKPQDHSDKPKPAEEKS